MLYVLKDSRRKYLQKFLLITLYGASRRTTDYRRLTEASASRSGCPGVRIVRPKKSILCLKYMEITSMKISHLYTSRWSAVVRQSAGRRDGLASKVTVCHDGLCWKMTVRHDDLC